MERIFLDTNIVLRFVTDDDPIKYEACQALFKRAEEGSVRLLTSHLVIAEIVWTLMSLYKMPKGDVIRIISLLVSNEHIEIPDQNTIVESLLLFSMKNIDFIDAYNAAVIKNSGMDSIYSYDTDFDKIGEITRLEP